MLSATRIAAAAAILAIVSTGLLFTLADDPATTPGGGGAIEPSELFAITLDGDAIPEEFVGVLFSRKSYPTDMDITYTPAFLPPNHFIRHIEAGELAIRPNSETQVVRAGSTWEEAEVVEAGEEALLGPGDTFAQLDIPWDEHGIDALGEMTTPGEDAVIVSLAIREQERCCSMSHPGMVSRWYHTLQQGVAELADGPFRMRVLRWELPVGASMQQTAPTVPSLWAVDAGQVTAAPVDAPDRAVTHRANSTVYTVQLDPGLEVLIANAGEEPAILYELLVEGAE